eukprot:2912457-Pleurochrysis_carterae.AAC.1
MRERENARFASRQCWHGQNEQHFLRQCDAARFFDQKNGSKRGKGEGNGDWTRRREENREA